MDNNEERKKLKAKFVEIINSIGYKVMYDLDKDLSHQMYDAYMLCTRVVETKDGLHRKRYVFLVTTYNSSLGFRNMKEFLPGGSREKEYNKFVEGLRNWMLEYTIDDVTAILLQAGFYLESFYQFINGKPRLKLDPSMIQILVDEGNMKGSPLKAYKRE